MTRTLFGQEHVEAYRETSGEIGHEWRDGVYTLLLTTNGRRTGRPFTTPLIYGRDGDDFVIIASKGGDASHPDWYLNLEAEPEVRIQVADEVMSATTRVATGDERARLWSMMAEIWPSYDDYRERTEREIPVVVVTPTS